jgi:GAF domain-containing protein
MSKRGLPPQLRWWGGTAIAAICAGAAFVAQVKAGEHLSAWASWAITLGGAVATMLVLVLPARQAWLEREDATSVATDAVTANRLALRSTLIPLTDIFDAIITAPDEKARMGAKGAMKNAVTNSVVQLIEVPQSRSCYFDYEREGEVAKLTCKLYSGRGPKPKTDFLNTDPRYEEIFQLLESRQSELRENTEVGDPPRFPRSGNYKTYISVPVATSVEIFGLLTLDALEPGQLKQEHEREMLLLAQLLGIALASRGSSRSSNIQKRIRSELPPISAS